MKKTLLAVSIAALLFSSAAFAGNGDGNNGNGNGNGGSNQPPVTGTYITPGSGAVSATSSVNGGTSSLSTLTGIGVSSHTAFATSQNQSFANGSSVPGVGGASVTASTGSTGLTNTNSSGTGNGGADAFANQSGTALAGVSAGAYLSAGVTGDHSTPVGAEVGSMTVSSGANVGTGSEAYVNGTGGLNNGTNAVATNNSFAGVGSAIGSGNSVNTNAQGTSTDVNQVSGIVNFAGGDNTSTLVGGAGASGTFDGSISASKIW